MKEFVCDLTEEDFDSDARVAARLADLPMYQSGRVSMQILVDQSRRFDARNAIRFALDMLHVVSRPGGGVRVSSITMDYEAEIAPVLVRFVLLPGAGAVPE